MKQVLLTILIALITSLVTSGYLNTKQGDLLADIVTDALSGSNVVIETLVVTGSIVETGSVETGTYIGVE